MPHDSSHGNRIIKRLRNEGEVDPEELDRYLLNASEAAVKSSSGSYTRKHTLRNLNTAGKLLEGKYGQER